MPVNKARGYARRLDPESELQMFRVGYRTEILTKYLLPGLGVSVTLVELLTSQPVGGESDGLRSKSKFAEARIEPLA
jgi:hypothetical protein